MAARSLPRPGDRSGLRTGTAGHRARRPRDPRTGRRPVGGGRGAVPPTRCCGAAVRPLRATTGLGSLAARAARRRQHRHRRRPEAVAESGPALLRPGGTVLVEIDPEPGSRWCGTARLRTRTGVGEPLPWAVVGLNALVELATGAHLRTTASYRGRRCFAELTPALSCRRGRSAGSQDVTRDATSAPTCGAVGSVSSNRQPGWELWTWMPPCCASASARAIASPRPAPDWASGVRAVLPR